MRGPVRELAIRRERAELVDRAPGHVHGAEARPRRRQQRDDHRLAACAPAERAPRRRRRLVAVRVEYRRQRAPVRRLLIEPAGEELRDLRIVHGARAQQLAQVGDRVLLDVRHVGDGAQGPLGQRAFDERGGIDRIGDDQVRPADVVGKRAVHATPYAAERGLDVGRPRRSGHSTRAPRLPLRSAEVTAFQHGDTEARSLAE